MCCTISFLWSASGVQKVEHAVDRLPKLGDGSCAGCMHAQHTLPYALMHACIFT